MKIVGEMYTFFLFVRLGKRKNKSFSRIFFKKKKEMRKICTLLRSSTTKIVVQTNNVLCCSGLFTFIIKMRYLCSFLGKEEGKWWKWNIFLLLFFLWTFFILISSFFKRKKYCTDKKSKTEIIKIIRRTKMFVCSMKKT